MQDIRTLLRHYYGEQSGKREVARLLQLSPGTVRNYLRRAEAAGLSWPLPEHLSDAELEALLFPHSEPTSSRPQPVWNQVHHQLSRKGMTLERIWFDWIQEYPDGYSYGHFCACYRKWCRAQKITMRIHHKAGERLYVDFAGKRMEVMDPNTGEVTKVQIFVAAMGGSNYTYVEAVPDQTLRSWIEAHVRCLTFLGAVPRIIVCDNLKAAVTRADRNAPVFNPTYADFARYYDLTLLAARVRKPQDKAVVEAAVKHGTTHILTRLESRQFFSIAELNQAISPLLDQLNRTPFQKKAGSRRSQFEELDRPAMNSLPAQSYCFRQWKKLKVNMNDHVYANGCYYSVPYRYAHQSLDVVISDHLVVCYSKNRELARHMRLVGTGLYSTVASHLPEHHRRYQDRERILSHARSVGPDTVRLIEMVLNRRKHQEQSFGSAKGILGLQERYGNERLENACSYALLLGERAHNYPSVSSILKYGREQLLEDIPTPPPVVHKNLRGGAYYTESNL
ncbi:MAG: IS21 family transposase [Bacteroidetes bacterium]|nr:IS21 family transposase [Bacteroidota bacterium]